MKKKVENYLLNSLILELRGKYLLLKEENKKSRVILLNHESRCVEWRKIQSSGF